MSGVSGVTSKQRSTDEMLDEVAHDAKIADGKDRIHSGAMSTSSAKAWSERHGEGGGAVGREAAVQGIEHGVEHVLEHGLMAGAGIAAGGLVAGGFVMGLHFLADEAWAKAHSDGDRIRALQTNDALNVGVADALALPGSFKKAVHEERPGVETGAEKVRTALQGKDASMVPILQARADEGYLATQQLMSDIAHLPSEQRAKALNEGLHNLTERGAHDVAFGLGVKLGAWAQAQDSKTRASIDADVNARVTPRPFHSQG